MSTTRSSFDQYCISHNTEQLLHPALKSTVSAPLHNFYFCPSSQQILATPLNEHHVVCKLGSCEWLFTDYVCTERFDHAPACDHRAAITGLASCIRLKLVASCSLDSTVRVWDCNNKLLRYALLGMELVPLVWHSLILVTHTRSFRFYFAAWFLCWPWGTGSSLAVCVWDHLVITTCSQPLITVNS